MHMHLFVLLYIQTQTCTRAYVISPRA